MNDQALDYAELPGWPDDDHSAAHDAFLKSFAQLRTAFPDLPEPGNLPARQYFETYFAPHAVPGHNDNGDGLLTGYYEPVLAGSRTRSDRFQTPLLRRPDDLETLMDDSLRASAAAALTHARRTASGLEPFPTRQEIEQGCLDQENLELLYLEDPVAAFFLHVQGSGIIELDDGNRIRVGYAAKNGHPYTSIGQALIADGAISAKDMSLQTLAAWLRADADRARRTMWRNQSYIFFDERGAAATCDTLGVHGIALTPGRSIAVDASVHAIGLPLFIAAEDLPGTAGATQRLMIAQDVGSAIRGAARADIFYGSGADAGALAGKTKHRGKLFALLPRVGT